MTFLTIWMPVAPECTCPPTEIAAAGTCAECPFPEQPPAGKALNGSASRPGIPRHREVEAIRHLAAADITRAELARQLGVSRSAVTQFAKRHRARVEQVRGQLDDEYAGLWITGQRNRLGAYQADYEMAAERPDAAHHDYIKARSAILHAVAEETGQLPGKLVVAVVPVVHVLEGVDVNDLQ